MFVIFRKLDINIDMTIAMPCKRKLNKRAQIADLVYYFLPMIIFSSKFVVQVHF